jgi:hypothetical protein
MGVRGLALSPDGRYLYAAAYTDQALTVLSRDLDSGNLTPYQTIFRNSGTGLPALNGAHQRRGQPGWGQRLHHRLPG